MEIMNNNSGSTQVICCRKLKPGAGNIQGTNVPMYRCTNANVRMWKCANVEMPARLLAGAGNYKL